MNVRAPSLALEPSQRADAKPLASDAPADAAVGAEFTSALEKSVSEANRAHAVAAEKEAALARGANDDLHGTMISVKEAEISLKLVGAVRNKLLDAFHELWRINL